MPFLRSSATRRTRFLFVHAFLPLVFAVALRTGKTVAAHTSTSAHEDIDTKGEVRLLETA